MTTHHLQYTLPNGLVVAQSNPTQIKQLYAEIFEEEIYIQHGITLQDGDCVFDVGANIGFFTFFVHKKCQNAHIYAFEPIPTTFEKLKANIVGNHIEAKLFACGLSNADQEVQFLSFPRLNMLSGLFSLEEAEQFIGSFVVETFPGQRQEALSSMKIDERLKKYLLRAETCTCPVRTLSSVMHSEQIGSIDLLKIDVEKSEFAVLQGIAEHDWPKIKQMVVEVHGTDILDQVLPLLREKGYHLHIGSEMMLAGNDQINAARKLYIIYALQKISGLA